MLSGKKGIVLAAIIPCIVFYAVFFLIPAVYCIFLSFHKWSFTSPMRFVGISNYIRALFKDELFPIAVKNTLLYMIFVTLGHQLFGLSLALVLVNYIRKGLVGTVRVIYFLPSVAVLIGICTIWRWMYQPRFGLFNQILAFLHLPPQMWLQSPSQALLSIMIMSIWRYVGYTAILYTAGLNSIPDVFYEAARIDGANKWQCFFKITLPLLMTTITFCVTIGTIGTIQVFTEIFVMTGQSQLSAGGPLHATRTIVFHLYERAFRWFTPGYASAIAVILFVIVATFTFLQLRVTRAKWEY